MQTQPITGTAYMIEEGDMVQVATNDFRTVEDIRENGRMYGVWFNFTDGSSVFHNYDDIITYKIAREE